MNESQFSLFGMPTPEEIRARIGRVEDERNIALSGGNPYLLFGRDLGTQIGEGIGRLTGRERPEVTAAIERQGRLREILSSAQEASEGDQNLFFQSLSNQLLQSGMIPEAMEIMQSLSQLDYQGAQTEKARAEAERSSAMPLLEAFKIRQSDRQAAVKAAQRDRELKLLEDKHDRSTKEGDRNYRIELARLKVQQDAEARKLSESETKIKDYTSKIQNRAQLLKVQEDRLELARTEAARRKAQNRINELRADLFQDYQDMKLLQLQDAYPDAKTFSDLPPEVSLPVYEEINQFMSSANVFERLLGQSIFNELNKPSNEDPMGID